MAGAIRGRSPGPRSVGGQALEAVAGAETHSVVMRSRSGTVRFIRARHRFEGLPAY